LEEKLEKVTAQIGKFAYLVMALSILTQLIFITFRIMFDGDQTILSGATLLDIMKILIIAVVILMVAIPEGLPLAVSISMALSVNNLKNDNILIKNLGCVQTCAMLHDICVGKTGTLTKGELSVKKYQICDQISTIDNDPVNDPDNFSNRLPIQSDLKQLIKECIYSNSDVRIETNENDYKYEPKGQAIEVGLM